MQPPPPGTDRPTSAAERMRAVRLDGPGLPPRLELVPVPRPAPDEALLKVLAAGVCHTELQLLDGTLGLGVWPLTPGHEIVGEVLQGPAELVGQRVLVYYSRPCGECAWCQAGQEQVCPNAGPQPGLSADGGFAELVRVAADCLVPLPEGLDVVEAAPLGCAAATALHALDGVAQVQSGECLVVYGVGGVGLALIQLGCLRGARVLAIGRSAAKLALARELGAETVDASDGDPVLAVRRLTRGEGAHVVFELVGSEQTLPAALDMARRQGRVVLVGYSSARLRLNPLELVLRETRLLSSLGNTRAELREVVRLAAAGALRVPVAGQYALAETAEALAALERGALVGRAVVVPGLAAASHPASPGRVTAGVTLPVTPQASHAAPQTSREAPQASHAAPQASHAPPQASHEAAEASRQPLGASHAALEASFVEPKASRVESKASREASHAQVMLGGAGRRPLEAELLDFVSRGLDQPADDAAFSDLALRLFAYQFANNRPYRLFCERRGQSPQTVRHWRQIPAVPIAAFKEALLAAEPTHGAVEFNSSGTTRPEHKSRHFHPSLDLYDLNARLNFKAHVLPDRERLRLLVLFPRRLALPNSSLAHWLELMVEAFGSADSDWFVSNEAGLDADRLAAVLREAREPVGLLAASFGLVHFLEHCQMHGLRFTLPAGSRVMDTGGYKGRSREYAKDELYGLVTERLGVPASHIVNMYGMTEHGTQFLDNVLRDHVRHGAEPVLRFKVVPPWARTRIVHPESLEDQPPGERGLLLHVDLINRASVVAVLSEDVGQRVGDGFELLGRAQGSEARGCSIALDELIEAVRSNGVAS